MPRLPIDGPYGEPPSPWAWLAIIGLSIALVVMVINGG